MHEKDFVIVTLGSMVEASSLGSMDLAPVLKGKCDGGAWTLWKKIAAHQSQFGRPANFSRPYRGIEVGVLHHDIP